MKIGTRIFFYLVAPLIVLMALFGWLGQRRSRAVLREELTREGRVLASTVQIAVQDAIRDRQIEDVHHLVNQISGYGGVLGVRVFDPSGALSYESANLKGVPVDQARSIAAALRERQVVESSTRVRGDPAISFVVPLVGKRGDLLGAVQVLQLVSFIETEALVAERAIAVLTTAMILAMGGVLLLVTRFSLGKPVEGLVRRFREVSSGDLASRVPARRGDEFGRLAQEFNGMCERLEIMQRSLHEEQEARRRMEGRLRQAEHLAGLGRLAAGLAHEIGTPLNVIVGRTESLTRRFSGNDAALRSFGIISAQIDRIARTVRGMLDFARLPQPRTGPTDVSALVHSNRASRRTASR